MRNKFYTDDEIYNLEHSLNEKFKKVFLKDKEGKTDFTDTTPPEKIIMDDDGSFMSVNDVFMNDPSYQRKASDNIPLWRRMTSNSIYVRYAIEQIINESIICDGRTAPLKLDFDINSKLLETTKTKIIKEWNYLASKVLNIKQNLTNHFKLWYSDGIIVFENVYNNDHINSGIKKVKVIDPNGLVYGNRNFKNTKKKVTNKKCWFYDKAGSVGNLSLNNSGILNIFNPFDYNTSNQEIFFENEQISYATSDIYDSTTGTYLSYLNFAVRPLNQLFAVENAFVVFALTRSTDKLVYYIDVGNLPEPKVKARIHEIARENSTQAKYDSSKGSVIDSPDKIKLTNELYLARRNGTKGTEVTNLSASNINFGDISVLQYLKDNLDTSLFMPRSRRNKDYKFQLGYAKEVDYEELAFYKFVLKLRSLFILAYRDILKKHLISKSIITEKEWDEEVQNDVMFIFNDNNDYERMKYIYDLQEKIAMIDNISAYVKLKPEDQDKITLFDIKHDILKKILQYNDDEIAQWEQRIEGQASSEKPENPTDGTQNSSGYAFPEDDDEQEPDLLEIYAKQKGNLKLSGDLEFKDLDTFGNFFEYLKENDEVVIKRNGKITNVKYKIKDGQLLEG